MALRETGLVLSAPVAAGRSATLAAPVRLPEHRLGEAGDVERYFGLVRRPFGVTPDPAFAYFSRAWWATLLELEDALRRRDGLIVLIGKSGTGKTMLCRTLLQQVDTRTFASLQSAPCTGIDDLLQRLLSDFGVAPAEACSHAPGAASTMHLTSALQRFLNSLIPLGAHGVLMIDEAQHLSDDLIEQLRLLSNLQTDESKLLQVVLVGSPELRDRLHRPALRHFRDRVTRMLTLEPLERNEVTAYVEHRLWVADGQVVVARPMGIPLATYGQSGVAERITPQFTPSALGTVARLSRGVPRSVNAICDRSLDIARGRSTRTINPAIVRQAARQSGQALRLPIPGGRVGAVATVLSLLAAGPITWAYWPSPAAAGTSPASAVTQPEHWDNHVTVGTVPVAAGIEVVAAAFRTNQRARTVSEEVTRAGLPAFVRSDRAGTQHQIVVGPYVTLEEAQGARASLATLGFADAHLGVQAPEIAGIGMAPVSALPTGSARAVLLVSSSERVSLVLEMAVEPRQVEVRSVASALEVDAGPVTGPVGAQELTIPAGVPFLAGVGIEAVPTAIDAQRMLRTRVSVGDGARGTVRTVGGRVYVDFTATQPATATTVRDVPQVRTAARGSDAYVAAVRPALLRLDEVEPFLLSATRSPTPHVLQALAQTLIEVQDNLRTLDVPGEARSRHDLLVSAVAAATSAVDVGFTGDRVAQARQALTQLEAAKAQMPQASEAK